VKTLDENSAKHLLHDRFETRGNEYRIPMYGIAQRLRPTTEDYLSGAYRESDARAQVQRLLKTGFITQSREDVKFLNVTGTYKAEVRGCGDGGLGIKNRVYSFSLLMAPTSSTISGEYTFDSWRNTGQKAATFRGPVTGNISPDGSVLLIYGPMSTRTNFKFRSEGTSLALIGPALFECDPTEITLSGTGPGGYVTEPKFSYGYSDKMKPLLDETGNLNAGRRVVDDVQNLLLETETIATAQYSWHVELNDAGVALAGSQRISKTSQVVFRKRPDGTWVLRED
jgi:hypothetical protein